MTKDWIWVLPSLAIPLVIAASAWTIHVASEGDAVAPNVSLAGRDLSNLDVEQAAEVVADRRKEFLATPVIIDIGERRLIVTAAELGFDYHFDETLAAVSSARHGAGPVSEFQMWVTTPFGPVTVADRFSLDIDVARARLSEDDFVLKAPVEPELSSDNVGRAKVVPGATGVGVDIEGVLDQLARADIADGTVEILADRMTIHPTMTDATAEEEAAVVQDWTSDGFVAVLDGSTVTLAPKQLRRHLRSTVTDGEMSLTVDLEGFQEEVESMFPEPIGTFVTPVLEVNEGLVEVVSPGEAADVCCSPESVARMADEILNDPHAFYRLEPRPEDDEEILAWADGSTIIEPVSEFTTSHACCESRVTNIQTIADAVTGVYLTPGQTLSLNEHVGPRTREKGYLSAGAIRGGYMTNELGGGVSQFATTLFNAAFFGGLDLDEYRAHSVYFSRYPYGREATLSNPDPDLVITNNTDYPVLIWPTYDSTSITVTIYSTRNVAVEELEQRITRRGACRHSEIDRQRTFTDGRVVVDTIIADYRPGNGLNCSGQPIPRRN